MGPAADGGEAAIRITFISPPTRRPGEIRSRRQSKQGPGHWGNPQKAWDRALLWGPGGPALMNSEEGGRVEWKMQGNVWGGGGGGEVLWDSASLGFKSLPSH